VSNPLVVASNVKKAFFHMGNTLEVLRGIDLTINEGEVVGIVGQSGAGKSTFLHCIGTLDIVTSGSLKIAGEELTQMNNARLADLRNRTIGFVFQFHHLLPEFTALENVVMPGLIQGKSKKDMTPRALQLLEEVGLKNRASHRPGELSGGEQQRVALARALVLEPKLLLADEPTGNLDSTTSQQIHDLFFSINQQRKTTIVVVTHNRELAASMPRVITLRDGRVDHDERRGGNYRAPQGDPLAAKAEAKVDVKTDEGAAGDPAGSPPPDTADEHIS
jgi:lipoprotein-releasing system ATP-binding protein